ncbi:hypothetical protein ACQWE9_26160, partial [Salmonella enterica subsp. enterica serovar Infantis]
KAASSLSSISPPQMAKFSRQLKCRHARVIAGINAKGVAIYCVDACFTRVESCHDINQGEVPCKR